MNTKCAVSVFAVLAATLPAHAAPAADVQGQSSNGKAESRLEFVSSDPSLVEGFAWAKRQALGFTFEGDPVGPWCEATLPGREAFCVRDVAHQALGAHALGLARHNLNMLRKYAENISESKDWCTYWEMDRHNRPSPVTYKSDSEYWYNLPSNFDIIDSCFRLYVWTGDRTYVTNSVLLNFYDRTVNEFVERWDLSLDRVMKRQRLMHTNTTSNPRSKFRETRGIPGYGELTPHRGPYALGVELLAAQYAAYQSYAQIQEVRGNEELAQRYMRKAGEVRALVNNEWWNAQEQYFYSSLSSDHQFEGRGGGDLLYRDILDDGPKLRSALKDLRDAIERGPSNNTEGKSHHPEIFYRFGDAEMARRQIIDLTRPNRERQDYPEVSFAVVGAVVSGTMGINPEFHSPLLAVVDTLWVEIVVRTRPALGNIAWAELRNLPIRANEVTVRHEGGRKTDFTNQHGPALIWRAEFDGAHDTLLVNGRPRKVRTEKQSLDRVVSWVEVSVPGSATASVEIPSQ